MKRTLRAGLALLLTAGFFLGGCSGCRKKDPATQLAELRQTAMQAAAQARVAREKRDLKGAEKAAGQTEDALAKAKKLLATAKDLGDAERQVEAELTGLAREARRWARLAKEDKRLLELQGSLRLRAYLKARNLAFGSLCKSCAVAAEQAAKTDPQTWPESIRGITQYLLRLNPGTGEKGPEVESATADDLLRQATALRKLADQPPPQLAAVLGAMLYLSGSPRLAAVELSQDGVLKSLSDPRLGDTLVVLRALALTACDLPLLAAEDLEKLVAARSETSPQPGPKTRAIAHALLAYIACQDADFVRAEQETLLAAKVWPDGPLAAFLGSEQLLASGQPAKAAEALEVAARDPRWEWLAPVLTKRARSIREQPVKAGSLLRQPQLVGEIFLLYFAHAASDSEAAATVRRWLEDARRFGGDLLDKTQKSFEEEAPAGEAPGLKPAPVPGSLQI